MAQLYYSHKNTFVGIFTGYYTFILDKNESCLTFSLMSERTRDVIIPLKWIFPELNLIM